MKIKEISAYLTEEQVNGRIREMGEEISRIYGGRVPDLYSEGIGVFYM